MHDPDRDAAFNPKISSRPKEVTVLPRMFPDGHAAIMPPAIPAHKMIAQVQQVQASEATETHCNRVRDDMAATDHRYQHKAERAQRTEKGDDAICRYCNMSFATKSARFCTNYCENIYNIINSGLLRRLNMRPPPVYGTAWDTNNRIKEEASEPASGLLRKNWSGRAPRLPNEAPACGLPIPRRWRG